MSAPIRTIAVVGAGPTGQRLAAQLAGAGYRTILEDLSGQRRRALGVDPALGRVELGEDLERVAAQADLILEAAPDDLETKFEVYTLLDRAAAPACIFAATSPAWPVGEIASLTYRGPNVAGLWILPEGHGIVAGPETSRQTLTAVAQVARALEPWNDRIFSSKEKTASGL